MRTIPPAGARGRVRHVFTGDCPCPVLLSVPRSCCDSAGVRECECVGGTVCMGCACVTQTDVQCCDDGCSGQGPVCDPLETVTMAEWFDVLVERSLSRSRLEAGDRLLSCSARPCVRSCPQLHDYARGDARPRSLWQIDSSSRWGRCVCSYTSRSTWGWGGGMCNEVCCIVGWCPYTSFAAVFCRLSVGDRLSLCDHCL